MFKLIDAASSWSNKARNLEHYSQDEGKEIESLLIGHKVTKVADDHLMLDDGTMLKFVGNDGGCACSAGCYPLTELNGVDNIITKVELENKPSSDWTDSVDAEEGEGTYKIFVYADNARVNLATFEGSDGSGYYGTGYEILVRRATQEVSA